MGIVLISANLNEKEEAVLVALLRQFEDCFAWSYEDMPGLDASFVEHRLILKEGVIP